VSKKGNLIPELEEIFIEDVSMTPRILVVIGIKRSLIDKSSEPYTHIYHEFRIPAIIL